MITLYRNETKLLSTEINIGSKLSRQLMSDDYITLKFSLLEPIKFELGDFCDCAFGRYEVTSPYIPSYNESTGGYDYELRLEAEYRKWKNKIFQYRPQYGGLEASWSLTAKIDVFMQVFLSNLSARGYKYKRATDYHVEYGDDVDLEKSYPLSFSNTNLIDALTQIAEKWETEWWIENNIIHIGKCQFGKEENALVFEDGVNVTKMSSSASKTDFATRLYVFGSTTNVPARYRKRLDFDVKKKGNNWFYDTARPLTLDMFKTIGESRIKTQALTGGSGQSTSNNTVTFTPSSEMKFSDIGRCYAKTSVCSMVITIDDPYGFWEKTTEMQGAFWGFYFHCNVKIKVGARQITKSGENTSYHVLGSSIANYTKDVFIRYDQKELGTFTLPDVDFLMSSDKPVDLEVTASVELVGDCILRFDHGTEPPDKELDIGAQKDKFTINYSLSSASCDFSKKWAEFNVLYLSGNNNGKSDVCRYYDGADTIRFQNIAPVLGDRYQITSNIITPKVPAYYFSDDYQSEIVKTGIVERHLMLPLSWNNGHNWIDAKENMSEEEIVEGVIVLNDYYPKAKCTVSKVLSYKIEQIDEKTGKKTGIYDTYYLVATDDMALKNEYMLKSADNFNINFNSGSCVGMTFEFDLKEKGYVFENAVLEDGTLGSLTLDRQYFHIYANETYGRLLPDSIIAPKVGDEFYVLNYDADYFDEMGLTAKAENELLAKGKEYMEKSKIDPNTYTCPLYWWYAKEHGTLSLGQRVKLVNAACFDSGYRMSRIIGMELNLDVPYDEATYTVGEAASYSRLGDMQNQIDEIKLNGTTYINNGSQSSGGNNIYIIKQADNTPATDFNVYSASRSDKNYPSKTNDDTISGTYTFQLWQKFLRGIQLGSEYSISELGEAVLKSLTLGKYGITSTGDATLGEIASTDYNADEQSGYGLKKRTDGKYKLSLTDLEVWGKAVFHELEIRKLSYVGGNFVFSPAGSSLYHVELVEGDYWCYILADDGEKATENLWKEGDLARCKTFNVKTGVYENVANKDYWRKVTWVSPNTYENNNSGKTILAGRKFHLIVLSGTDCMTGSDIPAAGDDICCLGSKTHATERGNAVMINTTGDGAPSFIQYAGINDYTLTGKEVTKLSPSGNIIRGAFYAQNGTKELSFVLDEQGKALDGLSKTIAELKVEADKISAKVDNVARTYRNLIPDSKVMLRSNGYEVCRRTVRLEAGTVYTLSARGTAENSLTSTGGSLRVYLYNAGWSFAQAVEITGEDQTASVTFDITESGNYNVAAYAWHNESVSVYDNRRAQEKGFFRLDYMQIEEGDTATPWTPAEEDPAVTGNLLPCLDEGGWVKASGTELTTDAYVVDGRHTTVAHYKDTKNKALMLLQCPVTLDGESTYTLSMWVKGTGTLGTVLGPACTVLAEDNQGHEATGTTGGVANTLTADWRKIIVRWSTAFSVYNMIKNSGYNDAAEQLTSWNRMGTWEVRANGMAYLTALPTSTGYGQISQTVSLTAGKIYTLQFSVTSFGLTLLLANTTLAEVYLDGKAVTATSSGSITIAADETITNHTVTFQAKNVEGNSQLVIFRFTQKYAGIGKVMLHEGHIPSVYHTQEDMNDTLVPVQLSAGGEVWVAGVKLEKSYRATEYTERTLTAGQLLPVGIDIEAQKIIATADNFVVRNRQGETTTAITADGQLTAGILATMNRGEGYVKAQDGLMEVFNGKGQLNIQFGLDPNSGMMVLSYYDNLGNLLYNLGPGGLEKKGLQTASVSTYPAERLGTFFANVIVMGGVTSYDDDVYHTNSDGDNIIDSKFKSQLMPSAATGAGYEPKSRMNQSADIYYYRAARVSNAYVADTANGINTPALAQQADGKWFNRRPLYLNGSLQLITSGVYIEKGEKLHWGTKKNGLNVLAIYVYNYYTDVDGTRERVEVFVE
ncbi:phage tail protein [Prevotella pectinovora]|uniref:phage tail protein n=1 Tax=Prevotella pectinovora TaxID=1602169 RepID=UPI00307A5223